MIKPNPLFNAVAIILYILIVVGLIFSLQSPNTPDVGILAPVFLLSLFTLSVAVMAFLFFYQPFKLYFDSRRNEALTYFIKTIGYFAGIVLVFFAALMFFRTPESITFPVGGEKLIQGEAYTLTWTGGREKVMQIFLVDTKMKGTDAAVAVKDKIYGIENIHSYTYSVPTTTKPGTYEFQIGSMTSGTFEIISK